MEKLSNVVQEFTAVVAGAVAAKLEVVFPRGHPFSPVHLWCNSSGSSCAPKTHSF